MHKKAKLILLHLAGWLLFFSLIFAFVANFQAGNSPSRWVRISSLAFVSLYVGLFYLNAHVLLPWLYFQRRYLWYFTLSFLLLSGVFAAAPFENFIVQQSRTFFEPGLRPPPHSPEFRRPPLKAGVRRDKPQQLDIVSVLLFLVVWTGSSVLPFLRRWRASERRASQAEADKIAAELSFLKAQIHPHFLFNTLNNIYSLAIVKSDATPDAVMKLSQMLRYVTDDASNDRVPLPLEINCAENFIALQSLRLSKKVSLSFTVSGPVERKTVPPLLLITFIENAFKYGISNHENCDIEIRISAKEDSLHFYCHNRIIRSADEGRTGIGISNAKKRLAHYYPQKYSLNIHTTDGYFIVDLLIDT